MSFPPTKLFPQNSHSLLVEEPKTINHLFEVIVQPHETFMNYVARLEAALWTITNLDQCLMLATFKRSILTVPRPLRKYSMITNLVMNSTQDLSGHKGSDFLAHSDRENYNAM